MRALAMSTQLGKVQKKVPPLSLGQTPHLAGIRLSNFFSPLTYPAWLSPATSADRPVMVRTLATGRPHYRYPPSIKL